MQAQVISTRYAQIDADGNRHRRERGEIIDVSKEEFDRGVENGALREPTEGDLPEPNAFAAPPILTTPAGDEITNAEDVEPVAGFTKANSHAEADAMASEMGVTFPAKTKLDAKNEALAQMAASQSEGTATAPATEDLSELGDDELIQRGIDFGHVEEEMADKSHDELVLMVAEAMNRQGQTAAAQQASVDERVEPAENTGGE